MRAAKQFVGLGELLWDLLPTGRQLGGAPANFTVMAARLGNRAAIASSLGEDELGEAARERLGRLPVDLSYVQRDHDHPTGAVSVTLREGQAEYRFHEQVAWDFLRLSPEWKELAGRADAVCFGSLAQRSAASRQAIRGFLEATFPECVCVFDVNLREPHFSAEGIDASLELATVLKLNEVEMPRVLGLLDLPGSRESDEVALRSGAETLLAAYPLELVAITLGGQGSLLVTREGWHRHRGLTTQVVDTVGAGDAFTAALTHYYLQGASLEVLNEAGNRWGSWVASQAGAMPELPADVRQRIETEIEAVRARR